MLPGKDNISMTTEHRVVTRLHGRGAPDDAATGAAFAALTLMLLRLSGNSCLLDPRRGMMPHPQAGWPRALRPAGGMVETVRCG